MKESLYLAADTVIVNLSGQFYNSVDEIVASEGFSAFLQRYFKELAVRDIRVYRWLTNGRPWEEIVPSLIELTGQLLVLPQQEAGNAGMSELDRMKSLYIVEDCYTYWRSKKRFTLLSGNRADAMADSFADYDEKYSSLIRQLYHTCRQKIMGKSEKVLRQTNCGSNASCLLMKYRIKLPSAYASLRNIPFIARLLLRTPIMMEFDSLPQDIDPVSLDDNPLASFRMDSRDFFCLPLKIGDSLCLTYFHKDYLAQAVCLANLFELADETDCLSRKADLICLFGLTGEQKYGFYHDRKNDIHMAAVSYDYRTEHFGNIKNAILTLYSLAQMDRGNLPVRGSMMEIFFRDESRKSLLLIGELGAGKSETIEALRTLSNEIRSEKSVRRVEVVFDDLGCLKVSDGRVVASGSEIGGFERIDDLWQSVYRDIEKGIFVNLQKQDPRVILPISSFEMVSADHPIDLVLYTNNYEDRIGIQRFEEYGQCRRCLIEGRHMSRDEEGREQLTSTYFVNPYGPAQKPEVCQPIMDEIFGKLYENGVFVGQLFTNLASDHQENLQESARCLWELLRQLPV